MPTNFPNSYLTLIISVIILSMQQSFDKRNLPCMNSKDPSGEKTYLSTPFGYQMKPYSNRVKNHNYPSKFTAHLIFLINTRHEHVMHNIY